MKRQEAREKAFQVLFQMDMNDIHPKNALKNFLDKDINDTFLIELIEGVVQYKDKIDLSISDHLENWTLNRIASVEKTILRLAVFEILYLDDIPVNVSINEAIELAHKFGEEKSGKFVNGVLSKIIKS